jgi:hypothetical protein
MSTGSSEITSRAPRVEFTDRFVQPPANLYVSADDAFHFRIASSQQSVTIRLSARLLVPGEGILYWQRTATTTALRAVEHFEFAGLEGFLLGLIVELDTTLDPGRWAFAAVELARGIVGGAHHFAALAHGYVTAANPLIWPGGHYIDPWQGRGTPFRFGVAIPAAGANAVDNVPTGARWRVMAGHLVFTTSAAAASRRMVLVFGDSGGAANVKCVANDFQTASLTREYEFGAWGFDDTVRSGISLVAVPPDLFLEAGDVIRTEVVALQAADAITAISLLVEEWFYPVVAP